MSDPKQRFTGLYDEYYRPVLRYALQHADPDCAEDVASETFLIAWRRLADIPEPPLPWLLGVARNLLRQQFGRARRQRRLTDQISALTTEADLRAWDTGEHVVERAAALAALGSLRDADVEALSLVTWLGLDAAEAAAVVITLPSSRGHQSAGTQAGTSPNSANSADGSQAILLTAAHTAASRPAATGTYWYVKERDFEPTAAVAGKYPKSKVKPAGKAPDYTAAYAATQETWTSATRTRTVVNEGLVFNFASAADKAKWQAAGSPKLANPAGKAGLTGPATSNYAFGGYSYNIGAIKVSLATARKLPTTPGKLDAVLRTAWQRLTPAQQEATVGLPQPTYAQYVFQVAGALLTGPVTPGTRAAVYELLAKQPGLTTATKVTDPLGRVGTAIGNDSEGFLVISPATADVLDQTSYPVRSGATIPATRYGTEAYLSLNWTNRLP